MRHHIQWALGIGSVLQSVSRTLRRCTVMPKFSRTIIISFERPSKVIKTLIVFEFATVPTFLLPFPCRTVWRNKGYVFGREMRAYRNANWMRFHIGGTDFIGLTGFGPNVGLRMRALCGWQSFRPTDGRPGLTRALCTRTRVFFSSLFFFSPLRLSLFIHCSSSSSLRFAAGLADQHRARPAVRAHLGAARGGPLSQRPLRRRNGAGHADWCVGGGRERKKERKKQGASHLRRREARAKKSKNESERAERGRHSSRLCYIVRAFFLSPRLPDAFPPVRRSLARSLGGSLARSLGC